MLKKTDPESRIKILEEEICNLTKDLKDIKKAVNNKATKVDRELKNTQHKILSLEQNITVLSNSIRK